MVKISIFLILPAAFLINGSFVSAHGAVEGPSDEVLHEATQIGLPGAKEGHIGRKDIEEGLTRTEIADLVHDGQDAENTRSAIKIILLALFLAVVLFLFYPRKHHPASTTDASAAMPPATASLAQSGGPPPPVANS